MSGESAAVSLVGLAWVAAWTTHAIVSAQNGWWLWLLLGTFFPPVSWVYGIVTWFGAWA